MDRRSMLSLSSAAMVGAGFAASGCSESGRAASIKDSQSTEQGHSSKPLLGFSDDPAQHFDFSQATSTRIAIQKLEIIWINDSEAMLIASLSDGRKAFLPSNKRFLDDIPMFTQRVLPYFLDQDLRKLESLIEQCYRVQYKLVGLPFWNAIGHMEMLALECLGLASQRSVADLLGGRKRDRVSVYLSSRERTTSPEQEIDEFMAERVAMVGAKACKLGVGGRMSRNLDAAPGRSEALVKRARKVFGDDFSICVDANGSYDAKQGIEVGKMLENYGIWFFEEPCPFEEFEMTKQVADALSLSVAGGEQDASTAKWRWMIEQKGLDIVQPDLFYAGGFLRSLRIARLASARGLSCVPHAPRAHAGAATLLQFVALLDKPGAHHEFAAKSVGRDAPYGYRPVFNIENGEITIPNGPGFGVSFDEAEIRRIGRALAFDVPSAPEDD